MRMTQAYATAGAIMRAELVETAALPPKARASVGIAVLEPSDELRYVTRSILREQGFAATEAYRAHDALAEALGDGDGRVDLILLDGGRDAKASGDLLRSLRLGEIGANPFCPVIETHWAVDGKLTLKAPPVGADAVLLKPYAVATLVRQIAYLARQRPPYVAATGYLGPDRRALSPRAARPGDGVVPVPNTLAERIDGGEVDPDTLARRSAVARRELHVAALHRDVARLSGIADDMIAALEDAERSVARVVAQAIAQVEFLIDAAAQAAQPEAGLLFQAARAELGAVRTGGEGVRSGARVIRRLGEAVTAALGERPGAMDERIRVALERAGSEDRHAG